MARGERCFSRSGRRVPENLRRSAVIDTSSRIGISLNEDLPEEAAGGLLSRSTILPWT